MHPLWKLLIFATVAIGALSVALVIAGDAISARETMEKGLGAVGFVAVFAMVFGLPGRSE